MLVIIMLITALSCSDIFRINRIGKPINFNASVERRDGTITRTSYSGDVIAGKERIDWENGDKILIYMYSDNGNRGDIQHERQIYAITGIKPEEFRSVARVGAVNDTLTWKGPNYRHFFLSVYPASFKGDLVNWNMDYYSGAYFKVASEQDGSMENMYLGAVAGYMNQGEKVTLDFYPLVTTLYFTLINDTKEVQRVQKIEVSSNAWEPISGTFQAGVDANTKRFIPWSNVSEGSNKITVTVNETIDTSKTLSIPLFMVPVNRSTEGMNVSITLGNKKLENSLKNKKVSQFDATKKYNLKVNLSGQGTEIDPEPEIPELPPVIIEDLEDGACQFIYAAIKPGLQEKFRELLGNDFINNKIDKMPKPVTAKAFYEMFTEDEIRTMLEYIQKASEIFITYDSGITSDISAEDLKRLIPCVRTLTVRIENDVTIYLDEMTLLQTINVEGNGKVIIHADNCDRLTSITWWDKQKQNGSGIYINGEWYLAK